MKIAPDLSDTQLDDIVDIFSSTHIDGLIATNTTISRENLRTDTKLINEIGNGGLSGLPVKKRSTEVIRYITNRSDGKIPIIGVGGIMNAEDAWEKITAGATLIQAYSGFVFEGAGLTKSVVHGLQKKLIQHGLSSLEEAVGLSHKNSEEVS